MHLSDLIHIFKSFARHFRDLARRYLFQLLLLPHFVSVERQVLDILLWLIKLIFAIEYLQLFLQHVCQSERVTADCLELLLVLEVGGSWLSLRNVAHIQEIDLNCVLWRGIAHTVLPRLAYELLGLRPTGVFELILNSLELHVEFRKLCNLFLISFFLRHTIHHLLLLFNKSKQRHILRQFIDTLNLWHHYDLVFRTL